MCHEKSEYFILAIDNLNVMTLPCGVPFIHAAGG